MIFQAGFHLKTGRTLLTDSEHVTYQAANDAASQVDASLRDRKGIQRVLVNGACVLIPNSSIDYVEFSIIELEEE